MSLSIKALVVVATLSFSTSALTDAGHADIGKPGKTPAAQRTVEITLVRCTSSLKLSTSKPARPCVS